MTRFAGEFFQWRNNQEVAELVTTTKVITQATNFKKERLLLAEDMPEYRDDQLTLILKHAASGSVKINEVEWSFSSAIENDGERPGSYPLRSKQVYLTRKNFEYRNVI